MKKVELNHNTKKLNQAFGLSDKTIDQIADQLVAYCLDERPSYSKLMEYAINTFADDEVSAIYIGIIAFQTPSKVYDPVYQSRAKKYRK